MGFSVLLWSSAYCAIGPAILFCLNLRRFRPPPALPAGEPPSLSVLIPARNEAANIGAALRCVRGSKDVRLQILVLDDDSTDDTAGIVTAQAADDPRVHLLSARTLPPGWNGKQHACWQLAHAATGPTLVFLDADVRVEPELLARMAAFQRQSRSALVSGFPRLITGSFLERLLLPLIHFVLLAYLPMGWMRRLRGGTRPSFAAGCGQFLMVERDAYFATGGHSAIRETMHDGLLLPKLFRSKGQRTDLADITSLASVRMYDSAGKVWQGLAKNATEGIATPAKIVPLSLVLLLGQVVPALVAFSATCTLVLLAVFHFSGDRLFSLLMRTGSPYLASIFLLSHGAFLVKAGPLTWWLAALLATSLLCSFLPRLLAVRRFRQPLGSALLHPLGILVLLVLQWYALIRKLVGKPVGWRQRTYSSQTGTEVG